MTMKSKQATTATDWKLSFRKQARFLVPAVCVFLFYLFATDRLAAKQNEQMVTMSSSSSRALSPELLRNDFFASPFMFDQDLMALFNKLNHPLPPDPFFLRAGGAGGLLTPQQYDIQEDDRAVTVTVAVPDVPLKDIDIEVIDGSVLHITGGRKTDHSTIKFEKIFGLGRHMDSESIEATLKDGQLKITTPKKNIELGDKNIRKIDIKTEL